VKGPLFLAIQDSLAKENSDICFFRIVFRQDSKCGKQAEWAYFLTKITKLGGLFSNFGFIEQKIFV
jgi:hypothetical protein